MISFFGTPIWPHAAKYDSGVITLDDIGWGLSRIVRFAGHTRRYYTVLMHSIVCAKLASPKSYYYALLHDAPEAFVADVPSPWKSAGAKDREDELLERIFTGPIGEELGLQWPWPQAIKDEVDQIDHMVLAAEAHTLGHGDPQQWWPLHRYSRSETFLKARMLTEEHWPMAIGAAMDPFDGLSLWHRAISGGASTHFAEGRGEDGQIINHDAGIERDDGHPGEYSE